MSAHSTSLVPSTRRPIPLEARADLTAERIRYQGINDWVLKDPVALKYFRLRAEQYAALRLLDGRRSLEEIREELGRQFPTTRLDLDDIRQLVSDLHAKGLVHSNRPGQGAVLLERRRRWRRQAVVRGLRSILYIKVPGWDPERLLRALYPRLHWAFHPLFLCVLAALVVSSWVLLAVQFGEFQRRVPEFQQFFGWPNVVWLWVTMGLAKLVHELAHGLACRHYGGECHEIGVAFLVFSPCLYCDVSDSWILRSKWKRIAIASAGMIVEIAISAAALLAWWYTRPGLLNHLCLNVCFVTAATTILFNLNPLLRYDGYYILSDLLEIPNLRTKADRLLRQLLARWCLGIELETDPFMPERGRLWFALYSAASAAYRWFLVFTIAFALYSMLKPYGLEVLGMAAGVLSGVSIIGGLLRSTYQILVAPRRRPMSLFRAAGTFAALALLIAGALCVPLPLHVEAPLVVEPLGVRHVYTSAAGRLVEVRVQPGDRVKRGDILARLDDFHMTDRMEQLRTALQVQQAEVTLSKTLDDPAREQIALAGLQAVEEQIRDHEARMRQLVLTAPCDGVVIAPPEHAAGEPNGPDGALPRWSGTPLEPRNQGCWLYPRTHLLSIAPDDRFQAVLVIAQHDREDFAAGRTVDIKFDHLPTDSVAAKVEIVSDRHLEIAPRQLSNKFGGDLATLTDRSGDERLTSAAYQATVPLDTPELPLTTGLRGRARLTVESRTAGAWLWRSLQRTLHFRL